MNRASDVLDEIRSDEPATKAKASGAVASGLWRRQTFEVVRLELKKTLFNRRAMLVYLLALAPLAILAFVTVVTRIYMPPDFDPISMGDMPLVFAGIYQGLILRTVIFFGCAWIFMNLFRGELIDRSLHYYFLAPVRREIIITGKFIAGLLASVIFFTTTTVGSMLLFFLMKDASIVRDYFLAGAGASQLVAYIGITCLACAGYGALFLVIGLIFRNPVLPALALYGWEAINFLLPPMLKRTSVIYYLQSMLPLKPSEGPFAFVAEPLPLAAAVTGLLLFVLVLLAVAAWRIRSMEVTYGSE